MSSQPLTCCNQPGCRNKVKNGYCDLHKPKRLNTDQDKLHNSKEWRKRSARYKKANPLCVMCSALGRVVAVYCVDHIISIANGGSFWDESNWQSLCKSHHNQKTRKELNARGLRY